VSADFQNKSRAQERPIVVLATHCLDVSIGLLATYLTMDIKGFRPASWLAILIQTQAAKDGIEP
jgi:hypothetical protein